MIQISRSGAVSGSTIMACQSLFCTESAHAYVVTVISTNVRTAGLVHPVTAGHVAYRDSVLCQRPDHCADDARHCSARNTAIGPRSSFQGVSVNVRTLRQACCLLWSRQCALTDHLATVHSELLRLLVKDLSLFGRQEDSYRCSGLGHQKSNSSTVGSALLVDANGEPLHSRRSTPQRRLRISTI